MFLPSTNQTPPQLAAAAVDGVADDVLAYRVRRYNDGMRAFWSTPGVTPQQVMDVFGTGATGMLAKTGHEKSEILSLNPAAPLVEAPADFRLNADGTVTILSTLTVESIAGATVTLSQSGQVLQTVTNPDTGNPDADRVSTFSGLTEGTYDLAGTVDGHLIVSQTVMVTRNAVVSLQVIPLYPVTVTGPAGASFTLNPTTPGLPAVPGTIPGDGTPATVDVPAGDYTLASALDGYADAPVAVTVDGPGVTVACGLTPANQQQ